MGTEMSSNLEKASSVGVDRRFTNTGTNVRDRRTGRVAHFQDVADATEALRRLSEDPTLISAFDWVTPDLSHWKTRLPNGT